MEPASSGAGARSRGKGGWRQRVQQLEAEEAQQGRGPPTGRSELVRQLLDKWAWGELTTPVVQQIAAAAFKDLQDGRCENQQALAEVRRLATLGAAGRSPQHVHEQLVRSLGEVPMTATTMLPLPVAANNPAGYVVRDVGVLMPHEHFACLYANYSRAWHEVFCPGGSTGLRSFWAAQAANPQYRDHPLRTRPDFQSMAVPLVLYGDGIPTTGVGKSWAKSLDCWYWGSCLSRGDSRAVCHLITVFFSKFYSKAPLRRTLDALYRVMAWSFEAIAAGKHPTLDWDGNPWGAGTRQAKVAGRPLAGGYYGVLYSLRGDLEFFRGHFGFPAANAMRPCIKCAATSSDTELRWSDFRRGEAGWMAAQYVDREGCKHRILALAGVNVHTVHVDYLHCKFLGVVQYFLGSVFFLAVYTFPGGRGRGFA